MALFIVVALIVLGIFLFTIIFGAPYVPSKQADIDTILSKQKGRGIFIDLGCGDGKVLLAAAKHNFEVVGYEINPLLWVIAKYRLRNHNARVHLKSYMAADVSRADVIYIFAAGPYIKKLVRILKQTKEGSTVISYGFVLPLRSHHEVVGGAYIYHL